VVDAVRRRQGTETYPGGPTANHVRCFVRGRGAGEVRFCADQMAGAGVLASHKMGRAIRYYLPGPEGIVDSRQVDNRTRAKNVYDPAQGRAQAHE
jgi:hypothetical protein